MTDQTSPTGDQPAIVDPAALTERYEAEAAAVRAALGDTPAEFYTAAELIALLSKLPGDTPVSVARHLRQDPQLDDAVDDERLAYAAEQILLTEEIPGTDNGRTVQSRPLPAVELGAFYVAQGRPVPADTVPVSPYDRALPGEGAVVDQALFDDFAELLTFVAGNLDGREDASLYELIGDPALTALAELEGQLLREAAARIVALGKRIEQHLDDDAEGGR